MDDTISDAACDAIEVTVLVSSHEGKSRRWCYFMTPRYIQQRFDRGEALPLLMGNHGIILPLLTQESIASALRYLENENLLLESTLPVDGGEGVGPRI